jgi:hypothetical protein
MLIPQVLQAPLPSYIITTMRSSHHHATKRVDSAFFPHGLKYKPKLLGYLTLLVLLTFASFWRVLSYGFWIDDWPLLWGSLFNIQATFRFYDHPALPISVFILSHIFGLNHVLWNLYGLCLKVLTALLTAYFLYKFTGSKIAGFLAGILFAASYAGLEVVDTPSISAIGIVAIALLISLIFFIKGMKENKSFLWISLLFLVVSLFLDPARAMAVLFIYPFLLLFFPNASKQLHKLKFLLKFLVVTALLGIPLFAIYLVHFKSDSQVAHAVSMLFHSPLNFLSKLNRLGNLFASIANLFIGPIYSLKQDVLDIGEHSRLFAITGAILLLVDLFAFGKFVREKSRAWGIISLFIFWTFIFYFPNYLSEPRAPMAGPHRYLFLSSIGLACLLGYILSLIHRKWLVVLLSCLIIILNIIKSNSILVWQSTYRSANTIDSMWHTVDREVPKNETNDLLVFKGQEPWLTQDIYFSQLAPFLIQRKMGTNYGDFPSLITIESDIPKYLCSPVTFNIGRRTYTKKQISISHIYGWNVVAPGKLINITPNVRKYAEKLVNQKGCRLH